ncbi:MAG: DUF4251 domain-containing protein [Bacteroidales bacterium]|nr:DUF4251 domain-containing protein [Bacteroidales bacterium]
MKKTILSIIAIVVALITMTAQASSEAYPQELSKKEQKELEKKKKAQEDSIAHAEAVNAIKNGSYILITERIYPLNIATNGQKINFVIFDKEQLTLQTGVIGAAGGNNLLGGITITAALKDKPKIEEKKNGQVNSSFSVTDEYIAGKVKVSLDKKDNYAEISLLEIKSGSKVSFAGRIIPFSQSMVGSAIQMGKPFIPDPTQGFGKGGRNDANLIISFLNGSKF